MTILSPPGHSPGRRVPKFSQEDGSPLIREVSSVLTVGGEYSKYILWV